jgi:NAD(P)-dependent dehydrogenase (short-subunit alcohol dehydrogenase family)
VISGNAFVGSIGQTNYAASKAGVMGMLYAWDVELQRFGIRTNALWPVADTDMTQVVFANAARQADKQGKPAPTALQLGFGTPESVAPVVVYLCSDRAAHLRSQLVGFNGTRLTVWQHPRELEPVKHDSWTIDQFDAALHDAAEPVHRPKF